MLKLIHHVRIKRLLLDLNLKNKSIKYLMILYYIYNQKICVDSNKIKLILMLKNISLLELNKFSAFSKDQSKY
jgi:hypothetical protein